MGKTSQSNLVIANDLPLGNVYNDCQYGQPQEEVKQQKGAMQTKPNPLYKQSTLKATNSLFKGSTGRSEELVNHETSHDCEITYDNITVSSNNVSVGEPEYAYCER